MKILLFGGAGQLGCELRKRAADLSFEVVSPVAAEVDITEREQVTKVIKATKPDIVINCAAYTAVDRAEEERDLAFKVNRDGPATIAYGCAESGARMIHISTDYVFDGSLGRPLREDDRKNPLSVYGASKWEGEEAVRSVLGDSSLIVRTQSLFGKGGVNFVQTMLKLFEEREEVRVVNDQWVSPTWAGWLAEVLLDLARSKAGGVVHASSEGVVSWYEFALAIKEATEPRYMGLRRARVEPTTAEALKRPAKRPAFSAFDTTRLRGILGRPAIRWSEALNGYLGDVGMLESV